MGVEMKLSEAQLERLAAEGFLVLPDRFSAREAAAIRARLPRLFSEKNEANIVERNAGVVRTAMGLHLRDDL